MELPQRRVLHITENRCIETELKGGGIDECQEQHFALERKDSFPVAMNLLQCACVRYCFLFRVICVSRYRGDHF
jgi:hypothetical protein